MKFLFSVFFVIVIVSFLSSTIINIPADQPTIQEGINVAVDGDTVLVQPVTYYENINYNGKNITVASLFITTQDSVYITQTIIDGNYNGSVVIFSNDEDSSAVLNGFIIRNGYHEAFPENYGAGILCNHSSPSLVNVIITNNSTPWDGGGIYCGYNSNPNLTNVTITGNDAYRGGGIYCFSNSSPSLENVTISENTAYHDIFSAAGGGMYCYNNSSPSLTNVSITDNSASDTGGGMYCYNNSNPSLQNVTITGNSAFYGGGIYCVEVYPYFNVENRCNIYLNNIIDSRGYGADIFALNCDTINVIVDTFTVLAPTDYHVSPICRFTFDILNGIDTLINSDIYVSVDGDNSNIGTSPDEPFRTIRYALSRIYADSVNHNTIYLLPGIYTTDTNGEIFPLEWSNYVSLEGFEEEETILDAAYLSGVMRFSYVSDAKIKNITIRNGFVSWFGGGIYCYDSSPSFINITITSNSAGWSGGGICCSGNSNPCLENVTITNNSSDNIGGGISCWCSHINLENVSIIGNSSLYGGGISFYESSSCQVNVTITDNSVSNDGGGIYCWDSSPILENIIITGNTASDDGGGIYCNGNSNPILVNCILWNDLPQEIYFSEEGDPNSITISYSDIQGGEAGIVTNNNGAVNWLEGNIDEDPLFGGTGGHPYSLLEDSPCIDAGIPDTTGLNLPPWDIIGNMRIWDGNGDGTAIIDMGAYEYGAPPYVNVDDSQLSIVDFQLYNYPNPFNPSTTIYFTTENAETCPPWRILIYNIKGQKVREIPIITPSPSHTLSVTWDGTDDNNKPVSSGIYFYKLKVSGKNEAVKKCLLLK